MSSTKSGIDRLVSLSRRSHRRSIQSLWLYDGCTLRFSVGCWTDHYHNIYIIYEDIGNAVIRTPVFTLQGVDYFCYRLFIPGCQSLSSIVSLSSSTPTLGNYHLNNEWQYTCSQHHHHHHHHCIHD